MFVLRFINDMLKKWHGKSVFFYFGGGGCKEKYVKVILP